MGFEFQQANKILTNLLLLADNQSNLPISSNVTSIISYFIQSLSKKSQVDSLKDKKARLLWFRNYFIGVLISILSNIDLTKCKMCIICLKELLLLLRYTPRYEQDEGIIKLWSIINNLYQKTPKNCENLLQIFSGSLKKLYKLTESIDGMNNLMVNVSFDAMSMCRNSIERSAKVQYFITISQYGNMRYTNTLSILLPIVTPLSLINEELLNKMSYEYCEGLLFIAQHNEELSKIIHSMQIYERLDVNGVLQFMKEMIKEDTNKYSFSTFNFYLLFHTASWIGLNCNNNITITNSIDLLIEYFFIILKKNNKSYDWMILILINKIINIFITNNSIPLNNSCLKIMTMIIENRVDLLMNIDQLLFKQFNDKVNKEIKFNKDKREYIIYYSSILSSGKTQKEKIWLYKIIYKFGINLSSFPSYFKVEGSRQIQGVLIALSKIIISLIQLGPSKNIYLIPYLKLFLNFEPTQPPIVKQTFIQCLSSIPLKLLYKLILLIKPNNSLSYPTIILRLFNCFLSDINPLIRELTAKNSPQILSPTLQYLYSLSPPSALAKYSTTTLTTTGIQRVSQLIAISYIIKQISIPSQNNRYFLNSTSIPRLPNPLSKYETPLLANILSFVPYILYQSFDRLQPSIQISGLHAFVRSIRYLCRTPSTIFLSNLINQAFNYLLEIIRAILTVHRPEYAIPFKYSLPIEPLAKEMILINARSDGIDNPVISLSSASFSALAVLLRRLKPTKEVFLLLKLFIDEHILPIHLAIREILRYDLKPYQKTEHPLYDSLCLEADAVRDFEVSELSQETWSQTATMISSVMRLVDNNALKHTETAVVTRCALSLIVAGLKYGKPNKPSKGIFGIDNEEDYIPNDFNEIYQQLLKGIEDDTLKHSKISSKHYFIPHFGLLPSLNLLSIESLKTNNEISQMTTFLEEIHFILKRGIRINDHFLTLLQLINIAKELFTNLIKYTPSYIDDYLDMHNIEMCAMKLSKKGLNGQKIIDSIIFEIADNPFSDKIIHWLTKIRDLNHCYSICLDVLLDSVKGDGIFQELRGQIVIPLYFASILQGLIDINTTITNEYVHRVIDLTVSDALMVFRCSTPLVIINEAEYLLREIRPDIAQALRGEIIIKTPTLKEFKEIESTLKLLSSKQELSQLFYQSLFDIFQPMPISLIEAITYSCLKFENRKYLEYILGKELPHNYDELFDILSKFLSKKIPSKSYITIQTINNFWKIQHFFDKRLPALRDSARNKDHNGQLMLYITKKQSHNILTHLHHKFLLNFIPTIPKNHILFDTDFSKILQDELWGNQTPPVNSNKQALQSLVSLQSILPISNYLKDSFIQRLLEAEETELLLSCLLHPFYFITFALDNPITLHIDHSIHYVKTHSFHFMKEDFLNQIKLKFNQNPLKYIRVLVACLPQFNQNDLYSIYQMSLSIVGGRSDSILVQYIQASVSAILSVCPEYSTPPPHSIMSVIAFEHSLVFISQSLLSPATRTTIIQELHEVLQGVVGEGRLVDKIDEVRKNWVGKITLRLLWDLICLSTNNQVFDQILVEDVFQDDNRNTDTQPLSMMDRRDSLLSRILVHLTDY
ncbi:hypothetical protein EDI_278530 [Entamoeba dispar SAW760]|uniref:Uncharacterized protein n=2 Tax=Entamoeba dispar (strain ATCC PRA-260 / SAW760) TaxID=370354 RepID=B0ECZ0_ENTDS|nr:uncharacterized protein EDI_278530 [Entamoeba dispar SAW760]EDR27682.1 hypothetical protein EDI_278530 [Entamoeba dispar SAW760]|eukprot:EDR27682.1 hypothetical protein EDI_278530 [Entamoeba dispar SAW760]